MLLSGPITHRNCSVCACSCPPAHGNDNWICPCPCFEPSQRLYDLAQASIFLTAHTLLFNVYVTLTVTVTVKCCEVNPSSSRICCACARSCPPAHAYHKWICPRPCFEPSQQLQMTMPLVCGKTAPTRLRMFDSSTCTAYARSLLSMCMLMPSDRSSNELHISLLYEIHFRPKGWRERTNNKITHTACPLAQVCSHQRVPSLISHSQALPIASPWQRGHAVSGHT